MLKSNYGSSKRRRRSKRGEFEDECQKINESIKRDKKFKDFIKSKHKEREELENLQKSTLLTTYLCSNSS